MTTWYASMALLWLALGTLWLRRAYVGRKAALLVTLFHARAEAESPRARMVHTFLGIANIGLGVAYLYLLLLKSGRLG